MRATACSASSRASSTVASRSRMVATERRSTVAWVDSTPAERLDCTAISALWRVSASRLSMVAATPASESRWLELPSASVSSRAEIWSMPLDRASMRWPASSMAPRDCPACSAVASISACTSAAAWLQRAARPRISPATTAKPRPASPAREASIEALSASMLVWKAMSSITALISATRRTLSCSADIAPMAACIASLPVEASPCSPAARCCSASAARLLAPTRLSSCCTLPTVRCSSADCSSVRWRSMSPPPDT